MFLNRVYCIYFVSKMGQDIAYYKLSYPKSNHLILHCNSNVVSASLQD